MNYLEQINFKQLCKNKKPSPEENAKEFYSKLKARASTGPIFSKNVINKTYAIDENLSKQEAKFIANLIETYYVSKHEIKLILEWSRQTKSNLLNYPYSILYEKAEEWKHSLKPRKNVIHTFPDGWYITQIKSKKDFKIEGTVLKNCLIDYTYEEDTKILILKDPNNKSHVVFELEKGKLGYYLAALKGKANSTPKPLYVGYVFEWFATQEYIKDLYYDWLDFFNKKNKLPDSYKEKYKALCKENPSILIDRIKSQKSRNIKKVLEKDRIGYCIKLLAMRYPPLKERVVYQLLQEKRYKELSLIPLSKKDKALIEAIIKEADSRNLEYYIKRYPAFIKNLSPRQKRAVKEKGILL